MRRSPAVRRWVWRRVNEMLGRDYGRLESWTFTNAGYAGLASGARLIELVPSAGPERHRAQLYAHVTGGVDLESGEILELGCGRGGGAAYLSRRLKPARVVGLDIARSQIEFCRRVHGNGRLEFIQGDAERLPFEDASFDAVVNVESSHCYGNMRRFLSEVFRVLRPGGYFLFADVRPARALGCLVGDLSGSGLVSIRTRNISPNVVRAFEIDGPRRLDGAGTRRRSLPTRALLGLADISGSRAPALLASGQLVYLSFVMQKPGGRSGFVENIELPRQHGIADAVAAVAGHGTKSVIEHFFTGGCARAT